MVCSVIMNLLNILFPRGRAEILRMLFADPGIELHLRELVRRSGLTLGTLQAEVQKLLETGLLRDRPDGNRRYFRANADHPAFADLRQLVLKTSGLHDVLAQSLADLATVRVAVIFGSFAAGTAQPDSDVDLLVIGDIGLRKLAPHLRNAADQLGREINPIVMTPSAFARDRKTSPLLIDVLAKPLIFIKGSAREFEQLA